MKERLSEKQNAVIYCLQNGWSLITSAFEREVTCCCTEYQFNFSLTIFWNLVHKELIHQQISHPFEYVLTDKGKSIKTKKVNF